MEATLRIYREGAERAVEEVPAIRSLLAEESELRRRAEELVGLLQDLDGLETAVVRCRSQAGSGSLPAREYPSWGVSLKAADRSADRWAMRLRTGNPPILARVWADLVLLDVRTLRGDELPWIAERLREIACR